MVEGRVRESAGRSRGGFRLAFVGAITACMLFALASVGGLGQAASAVGDVAVTAKRIVNTQGPTIVKKSSAASQYGKPTVKKKVKAEEGQGQEEGQGEAAGPPRRPAAVHRLSRAGSKVITGRLAAAP